ncbi:caspase family protein [Methylocystis sp. SB2]|uniref:caspase family protein n=1 Tax=Methylocystis sp. (strain SB2) TaxID=743836 RepID=UPI0009F83472|nr:caspase family protein [Methylocystis sp. SB2]ULO25079.1 caspase family protein [Methylocystis sp. SB2]
MFTRVFTLQLIKCAFVVLFCNTTADKSRAEEIEKFALIIGNSNYNTPGSFTPKDKTLKNHLNDLRNPCNDAELIAKSLLEAHWEEKDVSLACNLKRAEILELVEKFAFRFMVSKAPFGFLYYAGHGVQINDDTYIFGSDTEFDVNQTVEILKNHANARLFKGAVKLRDEILSTIGEPGNGSLLLVLDACRDNPLVPALKSKGVTMVSGPQKGEPLPGLKQLYSTAKGKPASDGSGGNSPFAQQFASELSKHDTVDHVIRGVVKTVYDKTKDSQLPQVPDETGSLMPPPPETCFRKCGG